MIALFFAGHRIGDWRTVRLAQAFSGEVGRESFADRCYLFQNLVTAASAANLLESVSNLLASVPRQPLGTNHH